MRKSSSEAGSGGGTFHIKRNLRGTKVLFRRFENFFTPTPGTNLPLRFFYVYHIKFYERKKLALANICIGSGGIQV